jgi:hypothetical protein
MIQTHQQHHLFPTSSLASGGSSLVRGHTIHQEFQWSTEKCSETINNPDPGIAKH